MVYGKVYSVAVHSGFDADYGMNVSSSLQLVLAFSRKGSPGSCQRP
jgi:hypothetical protein